MILLALAVFSLEILNVLSITPLFATKTNYLFSKVSRQKLSNDCDADLGPPDQSACRPIHLSAIYRHGTRYPKRKNGLKIMPSVNFFLNYLPHYRPAFSSGKHFNLDFFHEENSHQFMALAEVGRQEMGQLAGELYHRHGQLFSQPVSYRFVTSHKQRVRDSASYFLSSLAGLLDRSSDPTFSIDSAVVNDTLLRFYDGCARFEHEVVDNPRTDQESRQFLKSSFMEEVVQNFKRRHNIAAAEHFTTNHLMNLYTFVSYFSSLNNDTTLAEQLFIQEEIDAFELAADLHAYWKRAHGYPLTGQIACTLLADLFAGLNEAFEEDFHASTERPATVYLRFAHTETLLPLANVFEIFKDNLEFKAENGAKLLKSRQFRTTLLSPFSANFHLVLHSCTKSQARSAGAKSISHYVQFLVNGCSAKLPFCSSDNGNWCRYEDFAKFLSGKVLGCDVEELCSVSSRRDEL